MLRIFFSILFCTNYLAAILVPSDEFMAYHLQVAIEEIEDEDAFHLIQANVKNLKDRTASNGAANELIHLIEEGYKIDAFNMAELIATLTYKDASKNATKVLLKAIEHDSTITQGHLVSLIQTITYIDASDNATTVILKAIEHGVTFGLKARQLLAEISKRVSAKKNVEKIRKALHERAEKSPSDTKCYHFS